MKTEVTYVVVGGIIGLIIGLLAGVKSGVTGYETIKVADCEAELPRNQRCKLVAVPVEVE